MSLISLEKDQKISYSRAPAINDTTEELSLCVETLVDCDNAFNACNEVTEKLQNTIRLSDILVEENRKQIDGQAIEIKRLSIEVEHSHIPVIAGTSSFWILLLLIL